MGKAIGLNRLNPPGLRNVSAAKPSPDRFKIRKREAAARAARDIVGPRFHAPSMTRAEVESWLIKAFEFGARYALVGSLPTDTPGKAEVP